ncbi:hypothetical protein L1987_45854 [Smallanthus sonchifolius]|uniref:Uncharacterized protein n=1 Tax=Smallanthus sonchifolius TaxID=185202 RepID=A0ACB9FY46_9ASTR|nr:hypothetical protein L1987_45854 [Smallanthus sonchifolius]
MESSWKGRVKRVHLIEAYEEVDKAAEALSLAVTEDFLPVVLRIRATTASFGGPRGRNRMCSGAQSCLLQGKTFCTRCLCWDARRGTNQTVQAICGFKEYHEAGANAKTTVLELSRGLSAELQAKVNVLVFASMLLETVQTNGYHGMQITGLTPYWFDSAEGSGVRNTIDMKSMFLLTGPNGGGKSSLLRSICAAALFGICGFMVPAERKERAHFSLVLVDEICRGTETAKGTCIVASIVETLDSIGCLGIVSTHLHDIFKLPLTTKNTMFKAMGSEYVDGQTKPTWKLIDGICTESLAFETAKSEGVPDAIILRAEELYVSMHTTDMNSQKNELKDEQNLSNAKGSHKTDNHPTPVESVDQMNKFLKEVKSVVFMICQRTTSEVVIRCVVIAPRQQPPPSAIGASSVYVILRPDNGLYVGEAIHLTSLMITDELEGRVRAHRSKQGMQNASFLYFLVPGKSLACQLETLLINQLMNIADGKHRNFGTCDVSILSIILHW